MGKTFTDIEMADNEIGSVINFIPMAMVPAFFIWLWHKCQNSLFYEITAFALKMSRDMAMMINGLIGKG